MTHLLHVAYCSASNETVLLYSSLICRALTYFHFHCGSKAHVWTVMNAIWRRCGASLRFWHRMSWLTYLLTYLRALARYNTVYDNHTHNHTRWSTGSVCLEFRFCVLSPFSRPSVSVVHSATGCVERLVRPVGRQTGLTCLLTYICLRLIASTCFDFYRSTQQKWTERQAQYRSIIWQPVRCSVCKNSDGITKSSTPLLWYQRRCQY